MNPKILCLLFGFSLVFLSQNHGQDSDLIEKRINQQIRRAMERGENTIPRNGWDFKVKNVIVLVPDGCSQSVLTLARWFKGNNLTLDQMHVGVTRHHMANSVITDSAAAATAFSTGFKTTGRFMSVGPRKSDVLSTYKWPEPSTTLSYRPLATVLEGAKLLGMSTGLVCTSRFSHATPGAWASHSQDRGNEHTDISEQMVYNHLDLVFGGGERSLVPISKGGKRIDGEDLIQVLVNRNYAIARTRAEMSALTQLPVFGLFAWSHMEAEIDRPIYTPHEPSLKEMTETAISLLSKNNKGFFLMVEGSQVDWACHNNDPIWMITDFLQFDGAMKAALDFAKSDGQTLVLAYPDHTTGGIDIGNRASSGAYSHLTVEELVDPLKGMTVTAGALASEIKAMPGGVNTINIQVKTKELWNMDVTQAVAQEIIDLMGMGPGGYSISFSYALARVLSEHYTVIGWTSHGHTGEDAPVWAYGPYAPKGFMDNTDLAEAAAIALGLDLDLLNKWLFIDLDNLFPNWTLDKSDPMNPVATLSGKWAQGELPCSKDLLIIRTNWGTKHIYNLPGVVVHAPATKRVYVNMWCVLLLKIWGF